MWKPPLALQKYVQYFWTDDLLNYQIPGEIRVNNFAENNPRLFFLVPREGSTLSLEGGSALPICHIKGIDTNANLVKISPNACIIGVCFYPHALQKIFDISSEELKDSRIDIAEVKGQDLLELLLQGDTFEERIAIMSFYFYKKIQNSKLKENLLVPHIIQQHVLQYNTSLDELTSRFNISRRHFERLFKEETGISPKKYQSLLRFEEALGIMKDEKFLTEIAFDLGFTDQSHLIKEFKKYSGLTPKKYIQLNALGDFDTIILEKGND